MVIYLDSNVFIFAAISKDHRAVKSKEILKNMILGKFLAVTSSLTIDEIVWKIWKETKNRTLAIEEGLKILQFDNLGIIGIDKAIISESLNLMKKYTSLKPRDAIHLSAAIRSKSSVIISDDSDFDKINIIKRKSLD